MCPLGRCSRYLGSLPIEGKDHDHLPPPTPTPWPWTPVTAGQAGEVAELSSMCPAWNFEILQCFTKYDRCAFPCWSFEIWLFTHFRIYHFHEFYTHLYNRGAIWHGIMYGIQQGQSWYIFQTFNSQRQPYLGGHLIIFREKDCVIIVLDCISSWLIWGIMGFWL